MKYKSVAGVLVAASTAALLTACGGGGGGGGGSASGAGLTITGTAATGTSFYAANVVAECEGGSGSAVTALDGSFRILIASGSTPCMLQASGTTADGTRLVLHSAVGDAPAGKATANLTPVTELTLARAMGKTPKEVFDSRDAEARRRLTEALLAQMAALMNAAISNAGIPMEGIDPFKKPFQAAHGLIPGDAYDKLLDQLTAMVRPAGLPVLVNQVAVSAANGDAANIVTQALAGGSLPGCPTALSGPYRTLDLWGKTVMRDVDFRNMRMRASNGVDWLTLTASFTEACSFVANGTVDGRATEISIVLGASGAGAYRTHYSDTNSPGINGYIFPVQPHAVAEVDGTWSFLHSGSFPGEGNNHYPGQLKFDAAAGTMSACGYDTDTWICNAYPGAASTVTARADGGFDITAPDASGVPVRAYAYRAPSGTLTLFGSQLQGAYDDPNAFLTSYVAAKLQTLPLPAVGSVTKYWDIQFTSNDGIYSTNVPRADAVTVDSVDAATRTVMRHRASDGRQDTLQYDQPLTGTRFRLPAQTYAAAIQVPLQGLGIVVSANAQPALQTGVMFHVLSVERP
jgi:hypothetical protein